ncbi:MAG: divalent-cation tolerance protein CutA [Rhodobacteraceae bacterium]|nr:divalent-cation tolerance protein CutA [Paracoccaceae bacterium]
MTALTLVRTTFPDRNSAMDAVEPILTARLAACANLSEIASLYHWDGALQEEGEIAVLFKTRAALVAQLCAAIRKTHPYELPAITWWEVETDNATAGWLAAETRA